MRVLNEIDYSYAPPPAHWLGYFTQNHGHEEHRKTRNS